MTPSLQEVTWTTADDQVFINFSPPCQMFPGTNKHILRVFSSFLIKFLIGFFVVVFKFSEVEKIIDTWLMCSSRRLVVLLVVAGDLEKGILFCSYFCSTNHYNPV